MADSSRVVQEREAFDLFTAKDSPFRVMSWTEVNGGVDLMIEFFRDYDALRDLAKKPGLFHVVGDLGRTGVALFNQRVELTYYPPGTPRNQLYGYRLVKWEGLVFTLISIQAKARRFAERVAAKTALRLVDGVPTLFGGGAPPKSFPMRGGHVWTLEFAPGSPLAHPASREFYGSIEGDVIEREGRRYVESTRRN